MILSEIELFCGAWSSWSHSLYLSGSERDYVKSPLVCHDDGRPGLDCSVTRRRHREFGDETIG